MSKKVSFLTVLTLILLLIRLSLTEPDNTPEVIFCDVGQGDAALVQKGTFQLLIDAGPDGSVSECLQHNMPFGDRTIDWVIISHPHSDHYQGLIDVLNSYRVANIMIDDLPQKDQYWAKLYSSIMDAVENGQTVVHSSGINESWRFFENLSFQVIRVPENCSPEKIFSKRFSEEKLSAISTKCTQLIKNMNNASIGIILNVDNILFTFTGDLEASGELALVQSGLLTKTDVLKIPHHGSKTSSTTDFLEVLEPKIAVISVAAKNSYGHPNADVLARLTERNVLIYRTDRDGELHFRVSAGVLQVME